MQQQQCRQPADSTAAGFASAADATAMQAETSSAAAAALLLAADRSLPALQDSCLTLPQQQQRQQQQGSLKRKRGPPPTVLIDGYIEYEVAAIIDHLLKPAGQHGSRLLYCIRWKGYGSESDSWEPVSNMRNCQQLLQEYNVLYGVCMWVDCLFVSIVVNTSEMTALKRVLSWL
jgi:hypothetical protein